MLRFIKNYARAHSAQHTIFKFKPLVVFYSSKSMLLAQRSETSVPLADKLRMADFRKRTWNSFFQKRQPDTMEIFSGIYPDNWRNRFNIR